MARFRRKARRASSRFTARRASRSRSGSNNPLMSVVLPAFAYGAVRQTAKDVITPVSSMLPLGDNNDEVVMGVAGYLLMKNTSGFLHDIGKAALYVESASLGHNIGNPLLSGMTGKVSTAISGAYNYGA